MNIFNFILNRLNLESVQKKVFILSLNNFSKLSHINMSTQIKNILDLDLLFVKMKQKQLLQYFSNYRRARFTSDVTVKTQFGKSG